MIGEASEGTVSEEEDKTGSRTETLRANKKAGPSLLQPTSFTSVYKES